MYELFVARRYLMPKRGQGFLSLITWISIGGVFLGVLALIVVLAVMNGFEKEMKSRIIGTNAHVLLLKSGTSGIEDPDEAMARCLRHPEVTAVAPFLFGKVLISRKEFADGAAVKGIDLELESEVSDFEKFVESAPGKVLSLLPDEDGVPGIVLGVHVADNLRVQFGENVQIVSPMGSTKSPFGYVPKVRNFRVVGLFRSGMYEYDSSLAFIGISEAQSFYGTGDSVHGIEIRTAEMGRAPEVAADLLKEFGNFPYRVRDWIEMNQNLFSWMQTEKIAMFVILGLIVLVAAFNIMGALIMLVMEKKRDIGILRSLGATSQEIRTIFILEGGVIGLVGMALGTAGGLALCYLLDRYKFIELPADVYFIDTLPIDVQFTDIAVVLGVVLLISLAATMYPAWKASKLDPVEAIRHDG